MIRKERKILILDFLNVATPQEFIFEMEGIDFNVQTHSIGWDFKTAEALIQRYDGYVDAIALSGTRKSIGIGQTQVFHDQTLALFRLAKRSQVYIGDEIRNLFAEWTLKKVFKDHPHLVRGKKVLFHSVLASSFYEVFKANGARIFSADALVFSSLPVLLEGEANVERLTKGLKVLNWVKSYFNPNNKKQPLLKKLGEWVKQSDVFVTYSSLFEHIPDLSVVKGKIVFVDFLSRSQREQLEANGVAQVIEFVPHHPLLEAMRAKPFSLLSATIDQIRLAEDSPLAFNDFALEWISKLKIRPNRLKGERVEGARRCAFIVHPLSQRDIFRVPAFRPFKKTSKPVKDLVEKSLIRLPVFKYGLLTGAQSAFNGQEVVCDIYGIMGTPKQLLSNSEEMIYKKLVNASVMAQKDGALLFGLGAYTKIVGDAGVTVSRRSPLPVTTGNSYSVATTLWAARDMVAQMGFVKPHENGKRVHGRAMIIGATGSIGRVASLLVSLVFDDIVLVGQRSDKLLELREEVLAKSPHTKVKLSTHANADLPTADLIVTATSNLSGSILNINEVKPGAVICDCSRPLDISAEDAAKRPDVLVIESGEVHLPGTPDYNVDIGLPKPSVYACLAETILLTMEGRYEPFSLSRELSMDRVKEIYKIGLKHGAKLSAIRGPEGFITPERIAQARNLGREGLRDWAH